MIALLANPWVWLGAVGLATSVFVAGCNEGVSRTNAEWAAEKLEMQEVALDAAERLRSAEHNFSVTAETIRSTYANRLLVSDDALAVARTELRDARRNRPLAPAATAPAICRDHEATAAQLPLHEQTFLIGEADRADRIVVQLTACQQHAAAIDAALKAAAH